MCEGFLEVLDRQLKRYLSGDLSNRTPEMLAKTENAPLHNMYAEQTLGMVDAHIRRAPNASLDLISAKVKCTRNKTMEWLDSMPLETQSKIIKSAIKQQKTVNEQLKMRRQRDENIIQQRLHELIEKREKKKTREMEKTVGDLISQENVTECDITTAFPELNSDNSDIIINICKSPERMIDRECKHIWYDNETCKNVVYCGAFVDYKRNKKYPKYTIEYWLHDSPEDTHQLQLSPKQVISDIILGDMIFV